LALVNFSCLVDEHDLCFANNSTHRISYQSPRLPSNIRQMCVFSYARMTEIFYPVTLTLTWWPWHMPKMHQWNKNKRFRSRHTKRALILLKTWRYVSRLLTYLLT